MTPLRIDGWQQAFLVPEGEGGTVTLEYEPARIYQVGLIGAGVLLLVLAGLAFGRRRDAEPYAAEGRSVPPGPGPVLGTVALTLVGVVIAGPVALAVPVLAVVAHLRPGSSRRSRSRRWPRRASSRRWAPGRPRRRARERSARAPNSSH